jgi:hypothetical protein
MSRRSRTARVPAQFVLEPFAGSANRLHWIQRHIDAQRGVGFELDDAGFSLTEESLAIVNVRLDLVHGDYEAGLAAAGPKPRPSARHHRVGSAGLRRAPAASAPVR